MTCAEIIGQELFTRPGADCWPLAAITTPFTAQVNTLRLASALVKGRKGVSVLVRASLYFGLVPVCADAEVSAATLAPDEDKHMLARWGDGSGETLTFGVSVANVPVAARLIVNVINAKDGSPIAWGGCRLFTAQQVLVAGSQHLRLFRGGGDPASYSTMTSLNNYHDHKDEAPELVVS